MPLKRGNALPWVVTLLVVVGTAGLPGVPGANAEVGDSTMAAGVGLDLAQATAGTHAPPGIDEHETEDYDPWEPFNERMFSFNHEVLDRFVLKPAATVWGTVLPEPVQRGLGRAFHNLGAPRRLVNNLFQGNGPGVEQELARFLLNSTVGIAGFLDVAGRLGIEKSEADAGQTLGVYGVGPGPYLVLPFLPPLTVRDGVGSVVDLLLDPLNYLLPFAANAGRTAGQIVNDRSLNLELFQDVEEGAFDLYSAVRNGYLQRRRATVKERAAEVKKNLDAVRKEDPWQETRHWR